MGSGASVLRDSATDSPPLAGNPEPESPDGVSANNPQDVAREISKKVAYHIEHFFDAFEDVLQPDVLQVEDDDYRYDYHYDHDD